ncbi:MAG: DUF86 domain-containing protein [Coriobacteriia bacterium]|nr:DUF86 domain-containing protein [Coriobacteriia bacterium]
MQSIEARTRDGREAFMHDEMVQVWVVHHLEIIGEAATHVPAGIKAENPDVDWIAITATRNHVVHGYFEVDIEMVWETVERDMPILKRQVARILRSLPGNE